MMGSRMSKDELRLALDRIAASLSLEVDPSVALNDGRIHAAMTILERMGLDPSDKVCARLLRPIEAAGHQRMLAKQHLAVRAAATGRAGFEDVDEIWTGAELEGTVEP